MGDRFSETILERVLHGPHHVGHLVAKEAHVLTRSVIACEPIGGSTNHGASSRVASSMIENIDHRSSPALACSSARRTRCSSPNDERTDDLATDCELTEAIVEVAAELAMFASDLHRVPAALAGELPAAYLSITHLDAEIESRIYEQLVADLIEDASFPSYAFGVIEERERELEEDLALVQPEFVYRLLPTTV